MAMKPLLTDGLLPWLWEVFLRTKVTGPACTEAMSGAEIAK